jgi:hypothetical protein
VQGGVGFVVVWVGVVGVDCKWEFVIVSVLLWL